MKFGKDDWQQVLFVDEKTFMLRHETNKKMMLSMLIVVLKYQNTNNQISKKINAIAGIGFGGRKKLKLFEENLTSELYRENLRTTLIPEA